MGKEEKKNWLFEKGVCSLLILRVEILCVGENNRNVRKVQRFCRKSDLYLYAQVIIRMSYRSL